MLPALVPCGTEMKTVRPTRNSRLIGAYAVAHLERQRHQAVLLVGQAVDAGALPDDRKPRPGGDHVVRRELEANR